jgi:CRP-like cAMP-binding protein
MDYVQARAILAAHVRERFGRMLEMRDVLVVRKASGRTWRAELVCVTRNGDISVGHAALHEDGRIVEECSVDDVVDALLETRVEMVDPPRASRDTEGLFADLDMDGPESAPGFTAHDGGGLSLPGDQPSLRERIRSLKNSSVRADLVNARRLLPRLLADDEHRRYTLVEMGEVEVRLGENDLASQYLEAAAREFADRSEVRALELVASISLRVLGNEQFDKSPIKLLLDHSRRRLRPIERLGQASPFVGLGPAELAQLEAMASLSIISQGEVLLREGAEALRAFVVKSGILSIRLETHRGRSRLIRCCFPGDLVGETSVLGHAGATCTATVQAEALTTVWGFDGSRLRALSSATPMLRTRLEGARALHRLDAFFSLNETTQTLDARMRDHILSCVTGLRRTEVNELLNTPGSVPPVVYLIAEGSVEYAAEGAPTRDFRSDAWIGLRDALHNMRTEGTFVSAAECLLVCFDPTRLREFAADAPPDVVSVLERLD